MVTGALAAILAVRPNFDAGSTIRLIALTVEDIGPKGIDPMFGGGVVRVDRAINGLADILCGNWRNSSRTWYISSTLLLLE